MTKPEDAPAPAVGSLLNRGVIPARWVANACGDCLYDEADTGRDVMLRLDGNWRDDVVRLAYTASLLGTLNGLDVVAERERCCRVVAVQRDDARYDVARRTILAIRAGDDFHDVDDDVLADLNAAAPSAGLFARAAEEIERMRDCRLCVHFTTATGGCTSVVQCVDSSRYQSTTPRQYWLRCPTYKVSGACSPQAVRAPLDREVRQHSQLTKEAT